VSPGRVVPVFPVEESADVPVVEFVPVWVNVDAGLVAALAVPDGGPVTAGSAKTDNNTAAAVSPFAFGCAGLTALAPSNDVPVSHRCLALHPDASWGTAAAVTRRRSRSARSEVRATPIQPMRTRDAQIFAPTNAIGFHEDEQRAATRNPPERAASLQSALTD
jgi:hypothetical protein